MMALKLVVKTGEEAFGSASAFSHSQRSSVFLLSVASVSTSRSCTCWETQQEKDLQLLFILVGEENRRKETGRKCGTDPHRTEEMSGWG